METTKTGAEPDVALPDELVDALKEHIARLDAHPIASKSDLLLPADALPPAHRRRRFDRSRHDRRVTNRHPLRARAFYDDREATVEAIAAALEG